MRENKSRRTTKRANLELIAVNGVLRSLFESHTALGEGYQCLILKSNWSDIVGTSLARGTRPVKLTRQILTIGVPHSAWIQELYWVKDPIIEKVNKHLGKEWVKGLRFEVV